MINFCKHLQLNQNRRCFWYIVMLCKFISITGTRISPETEFPSPTVCFFLKVTTVAHIIRSISAVLTFVEHPWPQPNLTSREQPSHRSISWNPGLRSGNADNKARAVDETSWSTVETLYLWNKQDDSTFVFLIRVLAILIGIQLPLSVTTRFINESFVSLANMIHTSEYNTYCDIIFLGVFQQSSAATYKT